MTFISIWVGRRPMETQNPPRGRRMVATLHRAFIGKRCGPHAVAILFGEIDDAAFWLRKPSRFGTNLVDLPSWILQACSDWNSVGAWSDAFRCSCMCRRPEVPKGKLSCRGLYAQRILCGPKCRNSISPTLVASAASGGLWLFRAALTPSIISNAN